jgi:uncharacterized protein Yka (UPF0111/DUF47 family)
METTAAPPHTLDVIFRQHVDNTMECGRALQQLFQDIGGFAPHVVRIKRLEEHGDRLTAEAYQALDLLPYNEFIHLTEQFINRLDDIADGINDTARLVDFCTPRKTEAAAPELVATLLSMLERLQAELALYPNNDPASAGDCRATLKHWEEKADQLYHEWRKTQRRLNALPLVDESNWTEILGVLEQTNDAAYHAAMLLERIAKYRAGRRPVTQV